MLDVFFAVLPLAAIIIFILWFRMAADMAGLLCWLLCVVVACLYFHTPLSVALTASLSGFVASFPIGLAIGVAILQITVMVETGAISRVSALVKTVASHDISSQILLLNCGVSCLFTTLGAVPVSVLPSIMIAIGYPVTLAIALPAMGYSGVCFFALLGTPAQIFANFCGISLEETGLLFARFMPLTNIAVAFVCLWLTGRRARVKEGFWAALLMGLVCWAGAYGMARAGLVPLTGIAVGLGIILALLGLLAVRGRPIIDRSFLSEADLALERRMPLAAALSPWIILTLASLLINLPQLPLQKMFFYSYPHALEIIPGHPEKLRIFIQPYLWLLVSTLLALPFLRPAPGVLRLSIKKWLVRMPRPVFASSIYFSIAYVFTHSGKGVDRELTVMGNNMVHVLAAASASAFGPLYILVAPFMGLAAGIVSGTQTASTAMLTSLHLQTAKLINGPGLLIAAASSMGGGVASMLSPAKLMSAASTIDCIGEESSVLRTIVLLGVATTFSVVASCVIWML